MNVLSSVFSCILCCVSSSIITGDVITGPNVVIKHDLLQQHSQVQHLDIQKQRISNFLSGLSVFLVEKGVDMSPLAYQAMFLSIWLEKNSDCLFNKEKEKTLESTKSHSVVEGIHFKRSCSTVGARITSVFENGFVLYFPGIKLKKIDDTIMFLHIVIQSQKTLNFTFVKLCLPRYRGVCMDNSLFMSYKIHFIRQYSFCGCYATPLSVFITGNSVNITSKYEYQIDATVFSWRACYETLNSTIIQDYAIQSGGGHKTLSFGLPFGVQAATKAIRQWFFKALPFQSCSMTLNNIFGKTLSVSIFDGPGTKSPLILSIKNTNSQLPSYSVHTTSNQFLITMTADKEEYPVQFDVNVSATNARFNSDICYMKKTKASKGSFVYVIGVHQVYRLSNVQCSYQLKTMVPQGTAIEATLKLLSLHFEGPDTLFVNLRSFQENFQEQDNICDYGGFSMADPGAFHYHHFKPMVKLFWCKNINNPFEMTWQSNGTIHNSVVLSFNTYKAYSVGTFKAVIRLRMLSYTLLHQLDYFGTTGDPEEYATVESNSTGFRPQIIYYHLGSMTSLAGIRLQRSLGFLGPTDVRASTPDCITELQCYEKKQKDCTGYMLLNYEGYHEGQLKLIDSGEWYFLKMVKHATIYNRMCPHSGVLYILMEFKHYLVRPTSSIMLDRGHSYLIELDYVENAQFQLLNSHSGVQWDWTYFHITHRVIQQTLGQELTVSPNHDKSCLIEGLVLSESSKYFTYRFVKERLEICMLLSICIKFTVE